MSIWVRGSSSSGRSGERTVSTTTPSAFTQTILDKGVDYLLALKDNWLVLAEDVRLFFADSGKACLDTHETTDLDHGRSETRRDVVCHDVDLRAIVTQTA